jgi:tRNA (guanine37-N1)-methyltransferase
VTSNDGAPGGDASSVPHAAEDVLRIDVITLFPEMFAPLSHSILGRAIEQGRLTVNFVNPREHTVDRHRTVDDYPYGGGPGMVMKAEPIFLAVESVATPRTDVILLSPAGRVFSQQIAADLAQKRHLVLICGHYEGVDERVREHLVTDEISIGDYVLTGGELAAMVVVDAVARLLPGVLGHAESAGDESHSHGLLEYPQYTRPPEFRGWPVPERLLSGHHGEIAKWRRRRALETTAARRPDLMTPDLYAELADDGTKKRKRRRPANPAPGEGAESTVAASTRTEEADISTQADPRTPVRTASSATGASPEAGDPTGQYPAPADPPAGT